MTVDDIGPSKLKHRPFRDMAYSISEKTISGVHVSPGSAETSVRSGRITNQRSIVHFLSNISAKNYQYRLLWTEVLVCNYSVVV